jgi:hypothetical protein
MNEYPNTKIEVYLVQQQTITCENIFLIFRKKKSYSKKKIEKKKYIKD